MKPVSLKWARAVEAEPVRYVMETHDSVYRHKRAIKRLCQEVEMLRERVTDQEVAK